MVTRVDFTFPRILRRGLLGDPLRYTRNVLPSVLSLLILSAFAHAQDQPAMDSSFPPPPHAKEIHLKHILVISQTKGFEHDSIPDGLAAIYNMGHDSGLWDTTLR